MRGTLFSITLNLKNTAEMEIVQDAVALIMQRREHEAEERRKMWDQMALDEKGQEVEAQVKPLAPVTPSTPVAPPAASPVAVQTGSPADIETKLRAYSEQHGLAAARKLLTEEGIDRIGSATPAQKASLAARLDGLLAVAAA